MNKIHKGILCLIALAAIAAIKLFSYSLAVYEGRISELPEELRSVTTFNDCSMFAQEQGNPRRFVFCRDTGRAEAYLRFRIPKFDPSDYALRFSVRARPALLKDALLRTARSRVRCGKVGDGVITFSVDMKDSAAFMWSDGACYVGVTLPVAMLKDGDVVELLDFKFSLR